MTIDRIFGLYSTGKRCFLLLLAAALLCGVPARSQGLRNERTVSGVVLDAHREPVRGAVVQLENESTSAITTYLTDQDGRYSFKHVSTGDDYRVRATYRGRRSRSRELSKFSNNTAPVVRLVLRSR